MAKQPRRKIRGGKGNGFKVRGETHAGPPAHRSVVKRARELQLITERQLQAWELFVAGYTFEQIGTALKVSGKTAFYDCVNVRKALPDVLAADGLALVRRRAIRRLDDLWRHHWEGRRKPTMDLIRILEREAAILGYDAPKQTGIAVEDVARLLAAMRASVLQHVADPEVRRVIAEAIRQQSRLLPGAVIDVPPVEPAPVSCPSTARKVCR